MIKQGERYLPWKVLRTWHSGHAETLAGVATTPRLVKGVELKKKKESEDLTGLDPSAMTQMTTQKYRYCLGDNKRGRITWCEYARGTCPGLVGWTS